MRETGNEASHWGFISLLLILFTQEYFTPTHYRQKKHSTSTGNKAPQSNPEGCDLLYLICTHSLQITGFY